MKTSKCTGEVIVYEHDIGHGRSWKYGKGNFNVDRAANDKASSIFVPEGCLVYLYQQAYFLLSTLF